MLKKYWENLTLIGIKENYPPNVIRQITNTNHFSFFISVIAFINFISDYAKGLYFYSLINLAISFFSVVFLLFNYIGLYKVSANGLVICMNAAIFTLASSGSIETGQFALFFPLIILSFFLIGVQEKKLLLFYITLSVLLLVITISTDFSIFLRKELSSKEIQYLFWESIFKLTTFTGFVLFTLVVVNENIEVNLLEEKGNLFAIFNNNLLSIVLLDSEMKIISFNKLAEDELFGNYRKKIYKDESVLEFILEKDKEKFIQNFMAALNGKPVQLEKKVNAQRSAQWYEINFISVNDDQKKNISVIFSFLNITEHKKSEKKIKRERKNAEDANQAKSKFLSKMSHGIRVPMNDIIGLTGVLLENNPRTDQIENIKILKFSAENLLGIVNDILDFNRIETGRIGLDFLDFNLKQLINALSLFLGSLIQNKPIKFITTYDENIPSFIIGDSIRLSQIITNLIGNAIKFTESGEINLKINLEEIEADNVNIGFSISDTGIGISEAKIDYIFESFTQSHSDTYRKYGGTGLGLAITKGILDALNSSLFIESELGKGSEFHFSLQFKKSNYSTSSLKEISDAKNNHSKKVLLKGIRVLLVEDYPINQLVVSEFLNQWEIFIDIADNGIQALEKVKSSDYDVILMDLQMPKMDGYEATRQIRQMGFEKYQNIPIIALSASAISEIQDQMMQAGMNDYISKPFNSKDLFEKLLQYTVKKN